MAEENEATAEPEQAAPETSPEPKAPDTPFARAVAALQIPESEDGGESSEDVPGEEKGTEDEDAAEKQTEEVEENEKSKPGEERNRWLALERAEQRVRMERQQAKAEIQQAKAELERVRKEADAYSRAQQGDFTAFNELGIDYSKWAEHQLGIQRQQGQEDPRIEAMQKQLEELQQQRQTYEQQAVQTQYSAKLRGVIDKDPDRWELVRLHPGWEQYAYEAQVISHQNTGQVLPDEVLLDRLEKAIEEQLDSPLFKAKKFQRRFQAPPASKSEPSESQPKSEMGDALKSPTTLTNGVAAQVGSRDPRRMTREERMRRAEMALKAADGE